MRAGDLVRFRENDHAEWQGGLLLRYDKFIKIGEVLKDDRIFYAPGRLIEVFKRGKK